ncbi:hypothetical protein H4R99_003199 [Coemansia sp. RSA 1722]|nr:hypothetical protein H4R99_003199 [Coemansia sp. RSA 1722]
MDRDSEVETVLADEDWLDTSRENAHRRRNRRPNPVSSAREPIEEFDEEELFSTSGSLSSLHEFSDNDDSSSGTNSNSDNDGGDNIRSGGAGSENGAHSSASSVGGRSNNGPIIRNGTSNSDKNNLGINAGGHAVDAAVTSSAAHTESEIDVDGDDSRSFGALATASRKKAADSAAMGASPASSPSAWLSHRARKVIADDDDDDDDEDDSRGSNDDNEDDDADTEDAPGVKQRRKKSRLEKGIRRHGSGLSNRHSGSRAVAEHQRGRPAVEEIDRNDYTGTEHRKRHSDKRRKPRYEEPDYVDSNGCPQLVYFASKGDAGLCRKLLLRGASIDKTDSHGWTALHQACRNKHLDVLELLLNPPTRARLHSDAEAASDRSSVSENSDSRLVRQLRSPFPDVNKTTLQSRLTPLHQAVVSDDIQIVRLLLDNGAITSVANSRQLTPLDTCSSEKIARLLTDRAKVQRNISLRDKAGQTKLHRACNSGDLDLVVALINQGADINMKDNAGWTPLHEAALEGHNSVVVALLRHGADFKAKGFGGDTPLHDACANGHYDVVRSLLVVGADPQLKNNKGVTPEDMAREEEQDEVMPLIEQYRRVDVRELPSSASAHKVTVPAQTKSADGDKGKGRAPGSTLPASIRSDSIARSESGRISSAAADSITKSDNDAIRNDRSVSKAKHSTKKEKTSVSGSTSKERRSSSSQSQRPDSPPVTSAGLASQKRELVALRRLREEAEKPLVNYYFSSNSSKLSRDERKLQNLMGTIERLEKQRRPKERARQDSPESNNAFIEHMEPSVIVHNADGQENMWSSNVSVGIGGSNGTNGDKGVGNSGEGIVTNDADRRENSGLQSRSLSPNRHRGSIAKKRVIEDEDDNRDSNEAIDNMHSKNGSRKPGSKRAKHSSEIVGGRVVEEDANGRRSTALYESSGNRKKSASNAGSVNIDENNPFIKSLTPTVEIKSEYAGAGTGTGIGSKGGSAAMRPQSSSLQKDRPLKHKSAGGRTVDETLPSSAGTRATKGLTPASIAAQAIRYLPLYTIQLHCDPPTSKLDYFVVDLQIRLLLGMSVETPSEAKGEDADDERADTNPLFETYPHLCRQRITETQKEHLWEPLAGMFVSNMQFIHGTACPAMAAPGGQQGESLSSKPADSNKSFCADQSAADKDLVDQFTLHEKKKFVALSLYFVKLDEVVELIRQDYPQISQQLITITLDLSGIGLAGISLPSSPKKQLPRPIVKAIEKNEAQNSQPVWNGPQKMVPLRYALKLHYRESLAYKNSHNDA